MRVFYVLYPLPGIFHFYPFAGIASRATRRALPRPLLLTASATVKIDRTHSGALRAPQHGKINLPQTKIALHRTRLRFLDRKNFSVLFFYKPDRQPAPLLAVCRKTRTEKIEKNFSVFQ